MIIKNFAAPNPENNRLPFFCDLFFPKLPPDYVRNCLNFLK